MNLLSFYYNCPFCSISCLKVQEIIRTAIYIFNSMLAFILNVLFLQLFFHHPFTKLRRKMQQNTFKTKEFEMLIIYVSIILKPQIPSYMYS